MEEKSVFGIIYKATFPNGKCYIGQTVNDLNIRKSSHINDKKRKNAAFCRAMDKYGSESITWEVIDNAVSIEDLNEKEQYWISFFNSYINAEESNGYNMTIGGGSTTGWVPSLETKMRISESLKGRYGGANNPQYGKTGKLSTWWGRKHTDEERIKISTGNKGKPKSEETKRKISEANIGKIPWNIGIPRTDDEKRNISLSLVGRKLSSEALAKQKLCHKGERHGKATLTDTQVAKIIYLLLDGKKVKDLALEYGVSYNTIYLIKGNYTWKHVLPEIRNIIREDK